MNFTTKYITTDEIKKKNYTSDDIRMMSEAYKAVPNMDTVKRLATQLRKTKRSIISRLSLEGVYEKQRYLTKLGEPPRSKASYVKEIEDAFSIDLPSLDKTSKPSLRLLCESLISLNYDFEALLLEYEKEVEANRVMGEMLRKRA